jgi:hypothetical protein
MEMEPGCARRAILRCGRRFQPEWTARARRDELDGQYSVHSAAAAVRGMPVERDPKCPGKMRGGGLQYPRLVDILLHLGRHRLQTQ